MDRVRIVLSSITLALPRDLVCRLRMFKAFDNRAVSGAYSHSIQRDIADHVKHLGS
jgi:hypothetical protein